MVSLKNLILFFNYTQRHNWEQIFQAITRQITIIITGNYGEAGSINHYRKKFGLPETVSGISSYYYWRPGNPRATIAIFVGYPEDYCRRYFSEVKVMEVIRNQYGINNEEQGQLILLCRIPNKPMSELWPEFKHY